MIKHNIIDTGRPLVGRAVDGIEIAGTSEIRQHPGLRAVSNDQVTAVVLADGGVAMNEQWLSQMGVQQRLWSSTPGHPADEDSVTTDELLATAAESAMDAAGVDRSDVDLLIAATTTTSRLTTSMGAMATGRLGMRCATFELRAGCASAVYGLATAYAHLQMGAECVVVSAAETLTKVCPGSGPLPYLAGDGGAAAVLVRTGDTRSGMLASWLSADGSLNKLAGAPGRLPPVQEDMEDSLYRLVMDRRFDEAAAPWWPIAPAAALEAASLDADSVDALVLNQSNRRRLVETTSSLGIRQDALVDIVHETANAGAASMMAALHRVVSGSHLGLATGVDKSPVVLVGSVGGGLSAGSMAIRL